MKKRNWRPGERRFVSHLCYRCGKEGLSFELTEYAVALYLRSKGWSVDASGLAIFCVCPMCVRDDDREGMSLEWLKANPKKLTMPQEN